MKTFFLFLILAVVAGLCLNKTKYNRYLLVTIIICVLISFSSILEAQVPILVSKFNTESLQVVSTEFNDSLLIEILINTIKPHKNNNVYEYQYNDTRIFIWWDDNKFFLQIPEEEIYRDYFTIEETRALVKDYLLNH